MPMRYFSFVNGVAVSATIDAVNLLEFVDASAAGIFKLTGRRVVGGLLGGQSWETLWRLAHPIEAIDGVSAPSYFNRHNLSFLRDDRVSDDLFEAFIDGVEFFRRITLLPNAAEIIGEHDVIAYKPDKESFH
jgi:hypothetical protein